ncbi:MAG: type III-A CRISPR-associated protein Cas10/Csm1 [Thermoplasmata archaeon]|nr:type III-A CRISPR-associated protein Cas10/Csm1 [Thermoplasmata archaeon]
MSENDEIMKLRFVSLLHDIGKFWQGAGGKGKHEELSAKFVQQYLPDEIREGLSFIGGHHDGKQYLSEGYYPLKILVLADWLASSERKDLEEEEEKGKRKVTPMESIFSNIFLNGAAPHRKYYDIQSLFGTNIFPKVKEEIQEVTKSYNELWEKFVNEIEKLKDTNFEDKDSYFITLYYLLRKYTSFVPSAVWQSKPDISLFDHSRMTCAIAECIYKNGTGEEELKDILIALNKKEELTDYENELLNKKRFILIGGDVSGIQKFIYSIAAKGAAKGLKGRSFYLQLLSEAIAKYILKKLDLSIANLVYSAGGHFYILAPLEVDIERINKELENIMIEIHNGELYVAIDKVELSAKDFVEKNIGEKWRELSNKLGEKKKKKFSSILNAEFFTPNIDSNNVCQVCGLPSKYELIEEEDIKKCRLCKSFEELTERIAGKERIKARYIVECKPDGEEKEGTWEWNISKFGIKYIIVEDTNDVACNKGIIYTLNKGDFILRNGGNFAYGFKFLFQTPLMELSDLAKGADGIKKWGVLRGDVDNLGQIFSRGLDKKDRSISRISTLSSLMSFFFDYYINEICKEYQGKIYGVYAGGDDFFIIGSWNILPELANKIYGNFKEYTAHNPDITLSIGISIAPSEKYPIHRIAGAAGEELEKAKGIKRYYEEIGIEAKIEKEKDSIAFLGMPIKWNKYPELKEFKDELLKFMEKAPRGSLHKFYSIYKVYQIAKKKVRNTALAKYDNRYGKWRWMLAYTIARMKANGSKEKIKQLMIDNIDYAPIVIKWVEYLIRGDKNG